MTEKPNNNTDVLLGSTDKTIDWTLWVEQVECKMHEIGGITNALWEWNVGENAIDNIDLDDEEVRESVVAHADGRETARLSTVLQLQGLVRNNFLRLDYTMHS
mgnify:CR=1 FL=1